MRDAKYRAASAEAAVLDIAKQAKEAVSKLESRSLLLEAAMRVIMKYDLLNDFSHELNNPPRQASDVPEYRL